MPKINQEEYELLKEALEEGYGYIARDADTILEKYKEKPYKFIKGDVWRNKDNFYGETHEYLGKDNFQFIQWEDEEPYSIQELIEEYEIKELRTAPVGTVIVDLPESEETEVNFKEKLKQEIRDAGILKHYIDDDTTVEIELPTLDYIIDKMPETLSSEWIDENKVMFFNAYGENYYVHIDKLQNLLVPKQEELDQVYKAGYEKGKEHTIRSEKPVIPQFVAEHIDDCKERELTMHGLFYTANKENIMVANWMTDSGDFRERQELMGRAWLDGYEVESEKKYRITVAGHYVMFDTYGNMKTVTYGDSVTNEQSMKKVRFDIEKAIKSGIMEVEEVEE